MPVLPVGISKTRVPIFKNVPVLEPFFGVRENAYVFKVYTLI